MRVLETSRTPTLEEVLQVAMDSRLLDVHTCMPGRIESYDPATQKATVKPMIKRIELTEDAQTIEESIPELPEVPVVFPQGGGFFLSFPIAKGDFCLVFFTESSIDTWLSEQGEEANPIDTRRHDLSDAVALVGLNPFKKALPDAHAENLVLGKSGDVQIHVKTGEIDLGSENAADFVALAQKVLTELTGIVNGFNAHLHTGVTVGPGSSGPPATPLPAPGSVAAAKVKAD